MEVMCSIYLADFKNSLLATACRCGRMRRGVAVVGGEPGSFLVMRPTEGAAVVRGRERRTNLPPGRVF